MAQIVPTILARSVPEYREYVERYSSFAKRIQIDVADANFSAQPTISETNIWWAEGSVMTDVHMMVSDPSKHLDALIKLKPSLVIFHAEANENLLPIFQQLHDNEIKAGVALLKKTYPGAVQPYIEAADHVLIFAGKLGEHGDADMMQAEKVQLIRSIKSDVEIGWDGGANMANIRALAHGDIDVINVGRALMEAPDPAATLKELEAEADRLGVSI